MININEIIQELIDSGKDRNDAIRLAREEVRKRKIADKENLTYLNDQKMFFIRDNADRYKK